VKLTESNFFIKLGYYISFFFSSSLVDIWTIMLRVCHTVPPQHKTAKWFWL